jgi:hypothetical protein
MFGSCLLAHSLDTLFMLDRRAGKVPEIWPENALTGMPTRTGTEIAAELAGRKLLRLTQDQHEGPRAGVETWLTATTACPKCAGPVFHLPKQLAERSWAIPIEPAKVSEIQGPRRCIMGIGLEYYLPNGYEADAMIHYGVYIGDLGL